MSIKKIIGILSIFLITGIAFTTFNVSAHNPSHIDFKYDRDDANTVDHIVDQTIFITVIHGVTDPTFHYVFNITMFVNDSFLKTEIYDNQTTTNIFTYKFTGVVAGFHANITVIAFCSLGGYYEKKFTVGKWIIEDKGSFASIIPPTIVSTLLVAGIVMAPGISQKLKKRK